MIASDLSLHGWGAVCQEVTTGGLWTTEEHQPFEIESCLPCPSVLPEGECQHIFWYKAGQSHNHLILESYWETGLFLCVN